MAPVSLRFEQFRLFCLAAPLFSTEYESCISVTSPEAKIVTFLSQIQALSPNSVNFLFLLFKRWQRIKVLFFLRLESHSLGLRWCVQ